MSMRRMVRGNAALGGPGGTTSLDEHGLDDDRSNGGQGIDYISYISDMILELRSLAERDGTPTLAGILDLAYREARLEAERRGGRCDQSNT